MAAATMTYSMTSRTAFGDRFVWIGTITPTDTYATGGIAVDVPAIFGMRTINFILCEYGAYRLHYNVATGKIQIYTFTTTSTAQPAVADAIEELDNSTDLTNLGAIPVMVIGQ